MSHSKTYVSFQGHTHVPVIWEEKGDNVSCFHPVDKPLRLDETSHYAINVGSVGQPRDRDPRASYALYDYQNRILIHRRVEYDIARTPGTVQKSEAAGPQCQPAQKGTVMIALFSDIHANIEAFRSVLDDSPSEATEHFVINDHPVATGKNGPKSK